VTRKRKLKVKCPTCKQPVAVGVDDFPFCSERCRLLDLGKWASGEYVVSSPVQDISDQISRNPHDNDEQ
jgi:endogenous inhibitor of DNA gyrase (YacG/DUF329 family)